MSDERDIGHIVQERSDAMDLARTISDAVRRWDLAQSDANAYREAIYSLVKDCKENK